MARTRRSNRLSGATAKYTEDPFELAGVSASDSEAASTRKPTRRKGKAAARGDDSSDEEFQTTNTDNYRKEDDHSDDDVIADDDDDDGDGEEEEEEDQDDDDDDEAFSEDAGKTPSSRRKNTTALQRNLRKRHADGTLDLPPDYTHSRGTYNPLEHVGKSVHLRVTFGTDEKDLLAIVHVRDRWGRGLDSTFPTRVTLDGAHEMPDYSYGMGFGVAPEDLRRERTRGWDWYYSDDVGGRFRKKQRLTKIGEKEARQRYMPLDKGEQKTVLIGPVDNQKAFKLGQHDVVDFGEAWAEAGALKEGKKEGPYRPSRGKPSTATDDPQSAKRRKRQGWIVNVGEKVQCIAWAPNQNGLTQYLAVAVPVSKEQKEACPDPLMDQAAPAFRPSAPYPCAVQLWAFKAEKGESWTKSLDMNYRPKLRLSMCSEWGDIRRMAWCPISREPRDEDDEGVYKHVGLLAGIWSDGCVRVLDVKLDRDPGKSEFYKVMSPVFEAKPPSTTCTCLEWLSSSDIAVGCANGFVAIWSIAPSSSAPLTPLPYFFQPICSTYIMNIASAYPTHPHLLCTTSMDGETRLVSIIDSPKDMVETHRMRAGTPHLTYSPLVQSFLSSDENDFCRLLTLRKFYTTTAVAKLPSTASALAPSSFWHPSTLWGCTEGAVIATNPLRRLLHTKEKQWQQTWFTHEWAQGNDPEGPGISRFTDGFRAESISLLRNMVGDRKMVNGVSTVTIYNEETHVTALAWNPNQTCAGWASAGLGCGLLRVEDLAI